MIDYNQETLRIRNSFILFSFLLFIFSFSTSVAVDLLNIKSGSKIIDLGKISIIIAIICTYKSLYYLSRLNNDYYISKRIQFTKSTIERNSTRSVTDLALTDDVSFDKHSKDYLKDIDDQLSHIISQLQLLAKSLPDNDPKGSFNPRKHPTDVISDLNSSLRKIKDAHNDFENFYSTEQRSEKIVRTLFMYIVPYGVFFISMVSSLSYILTGMSELKKFFIG